MNKRTDLTVQADRAETTADEPASAKPVPAAKTVTTKAAPKQATAKTASAKQSAKVARTEAVDGAKASDTPDTLAKTDAATNSQSPPNAKAARGARSSRLLLVGVLAVITIACLVLSIVFLGRAADKRGGAPANLALVDQPKTQEVISQVSADVLKIFSYNYSNVAASQQAAESVLLDPGRHQYLTLLQLLQKNSQGQQLTLVVKVVQAAVMNLTDSTATVLVFLDQTSTRASDHASSTSAAQVQISAVKQDGAWKVNNIRTF